MWYPLSMAGSTGEISPLQTSDSRLLTIARSTGTPLAEPADRHDREAGVPVEGIEAGLAAGARR